jgi:hypothetical protein
VADGDKKGIIVEDVDPRCISRGLQLISTISYAPLWLGLATLAYCFGRLKGKVEDAYDMPGDLMDDFEWENGTDFGQSARFGLGGDEMPVRTVSQVLGSCSNRSSFRLTEVHGLGSAACIRVGRWNFER